MKALSLILAGVGAGLAARLVGWLRLNGYCSDGHRSGQYCSCDTLHTQSETEHQRLLLHKLRFAMVELEGRRRETNWAIPY